MSAARTDANQADIVRALRAAGCSVEVLDPRGRGGLPDLLVGFRGVNLLLEVKAKGGKLSPAQETWHQLWRGEKPKVVETEMEALVAVGIAVRLARRDGRAA